MKRLGRLLASGVIAASIVSCKRQDDPAVIRSDKTTVAPSASSAAAPAASPTPSSAPSTLASELAALEAQTLAELSGSSGVDPDSGLKGASGGGSVGTNGYGGGLEFIGGSGAVAGAASGEAASAVIARNRWRFKACFTKELAKNPKAEGKVMVKVEIDGAGEVKSAKAATTTAGKDLTDCVVNAFHSMKFAESDAGTTTIQVPIVLTSSK